MTVSKCLTKFIQGADRNRYANRFRNSTWINGMNKMNALNKITLLIYEYNTISIFYPGTMDFEITCVGIRIWTPCGVLLVLGLALGSE